MSIAIATTVAGPLAINISSILKDVLLTYAGFIFFNDVRATTPVLLGLALSFVGAIKCIHSKYKSDKIRTDDVSSELED